MNRDRKFNSKDASFSFCMSEDDIADPNSYFDVDIALHDHSIRGHRPSKSSSDSKEFDFAAPLDSSSSDFPNQSTNNVISTADELFYKGKLLPLYMSRAHRLEVSRNPSAETSIAFSCYLHRADVDVDMVMEPRPVPAGTTTTGPFDMNILYGRKRNEEDASVSSSRESSRNSRESESLKSDSSSGGDSSEESCSRSVQQQVLRNEAYSSGRFRWRLLLAGGQRNRPAGFDKTSTTTRTTNPHNCPQKQREQPQRKSEVSESSSGYNPRWSHSGGLSNLSSDKSSFLNNNNNDAFQFQRRNNAYQSLFKAKEFWRRYLKPLISRTPHPQHKSTTSFNSTADLQRQRRPRSTASTPLASPTHSGLLSVSASAPDDVQGAIAYCNQTRASGN